MRYAGRVPLLFVAGPVLVVAGSLVEPAPAPPPLPVDAPPAVVRSLPNVSPPYQTAAVAVRRHDFLGALHALERETARDDPQGRHARMVAGLYAHSLERPEDATDLLGEEPTLPGPIEDWRLWVLADSFTATDDSPRALAALERLLADWPDSPLWPRALIRAAELAQQTGKSERALALVDLGRGRRPHGEAGERLERLAWELAQATGNREVAAAAATTLLTQYPKAADELGVPGRFPVYLLPPDKLLLRAEALLTARQPTDARKVLDVVSTDDRGLDWHLLMARTFVALDQGASALFLLEPLKVEGDADAARLAFGRAQAAFEMAQARRGDKKAAAQRERSHRMAMGYLEEAARRGNGELRIKALRQLFEEHAEHERVDSALAVLARLRAADPKDDTGAKFLWERGWQQYRARNYTGAIGYWSELVALSPRDRYPRGARYWSARAFESMGEQARARALYAELATADTSDFYRRHAIVRLGGTAPAAPAVQPEPWPSDRLLDRARYLTDLGLDGLASAELEMVAGAADGRAKDALAGVILARQGQPRASMDRLRSAFPNLGTPLQASVPAPALELYYPLHYRDSVERWAGAHSLPVPLVLGIIRQESAFDTTATSWAGARGLMQLMPRTAGELAGKLGLSFATNKLYEPDYSIRLGTSYFAKVLEMFDGNVELALAGYNSGPYRLKRLWKEAPRREVDNFIENLSMEEPKVYVRRIVLLSDSYARLYPELDGKG